MAQAESVGTHMGVAIQMSRSFISLQGVATPFFFELGQQLRLAGHQTHRINFCGGDLLYSLFEPHTNYTGTLSALPGWFEQALRQHGATDILLFGDCRAIHQAAIAVAKKMNIRVYVFEEGYLRPNWITMESGGVNGYSNMATDPEVILAWTNSHAARNAEAPSHVGGSHMVLRAIYDIAYRLASAVMSWHFPNYQTHRPHNGVMEYAGLARRMGMRRRFEREARRVTNELLAAKVSFFLFPLQLNADSQIRTHSPFPDVIASIEKVLISFKNAGFDHSSNPVVLLIKNHPLDTGLAHYRSYAERRARELQLEDRVKFIEAGNLPLLMTHAKGVVLVNSTVGLAALNLHRPVYAMGKAIFNREMLTDQGSLASFWKDPKPPDAGFVKAFVAYVKAHSQVSGDFYSRVGRQHAVSNCMTRLLKDVP
jgi:capsular polysaccharide export protein